MFSLAVVINPFDCIGGGMECMLAHSLSEVGMVTPFERCVSVCSKVSFGSVGIMPGVFAHVTCWYVHGAICIWFGAVGVEKVWFVVVGVGVMLSAVVPKCLANFCHAFPWRP